ncbi:MAG TPA: hypothetical protein PLN21_11965 [Gemmatales bacterium]|nr:hypothetical protein [Gemmatales bacterium]
MLFVWISLSILVLIAAGLAARWWYLVQNDSIEPLSEVSQQHIDLYNGGSLDEGELELTRQRYSQWLQNDQRDRIQASLVPGLSYVVRVRALAELGTEEACAILENQLNRVLTDDPVEQAWYWIDVAHCLRMLAHDESLPILLERVAQADDFPLVHFYASEVVTFAQFADHLKDFPHRLGESAVRTLHRTLEGLRCGISAQIVAEARLGEMLETVWDLHGHAIHPLLIRLFSEALRHQRRARQFAQDLSEEHFEQEAYEMQVSRIAALEDHLLDYLKRAKETLPKRLDRLPHQELADWLDAILELRADAGPALLRLLRDSPHQPLSEQAILALAWSPSTQAADYLREIAGRTVPSKPFPTRRWFGKRKAQSIHSPLAAAALISLRHHPSMESEQIILSGVRSSDLDTRTAAISSLGWWDPLRRQPVLMYLQDARYDRDGEVRHAARAALARIGERQALQWFRQGLVSENRHIVLESIQAIADEGITLLWPELDRLVDEEEPDLASCAREALEQMQEELERERR